MMRVLLRSLVLAAITILVCGVAHAHPWTEGRPAVPFRADSDWGYRKLATLDDAALRRAYDEEPRGYYNRAEAFEAAIEYAAARWFESKSETFREFLVRACKASVGDCLTLPEDRLAALVSDKGSIDPTVHRVRDACWHLAVLYAVTEDPDCARRSATLLGAFAQQLPKWPLHSPYHLAEKTAFAQDDPRAYEHEFSAGLWGCWLHSDILLGVPLARAYDLIHSSGVLQERGLVKPVEAMLRRHVEIQDRFILFSNMDGSSLEGLLIFAEVLRDPEMVHKAVWWIKGLYKTQFYADGWWHEGTPSYHIQLHWRLQNILRNTLAGYSDPPGFVSARDKTRFDALDESIIGGAAARGDEALRRAWQPNGIYQVIHDTSFPHRAHGFAPITEGRSALSGCMGHATLATGKGEDVVQVSLHFSGIHGHSHLDSLNLLLFAKGKELIAETNYRPPDNAPNTTREWHTMTAGHATVVVDEKDQRNPSARRTRQPEDDIAGYPDWPWRWRGHGSGMDDGRLRLFATDYDGVQVVEADGERAYESLAANGMYRRTVALVRIDDADVYVLDIFRVKGGATHDYMLHGCLDVPHTAALSLPLEETVPGKLHKYIENVRASATDERWTCDFRLEGSDVGMKTFFLPAKGTRILSGDGPAMRRPGTAPFVAVRRSGGESVFVAVHHPHRGAPKVLAADLIPVVSADPMAVAVRVTLPDRTDTLLSASDPAPWRICRTRDGRILMRGRFAFLSEGGAEKRCAYLVDGRYLTWDDVRIEGAISHTGTLTRTRRREAGDAENAFLTPANLPTDGSLDGRTLMVDLGGLLVQSFRVRTVRSEDRLAVIESEDEPGMTIKQGLVKLEYFPGWGIRGAARFTLPGTALMDRGAEGAWRFRASGEAAARVGDATVPRNAAP